jgi:hypothetical protein
MPSKTIIKYAKNACKKSDCEHSLAAVLYKGGAVIRVACNENKTIAYRKKYFQHGEPSRHAEMNVIHSIPRDVITKCSLLVVRINKKGNLTSAKPCIACASALNDAGIKKVYYSSYTGEIIKLNFSELSDGKYVKENYLNYSR